MNLLKPLFSSGRILQVDLEELEQWINRFPYLLPVFAGSLKRIFQRSGTQVVNIQQINPARRFKYL